MWKFIINVSTHYNQICIWKHKFHMQNEVHILMDVSLELLLALAED